MAKDRSFLWHQHDHRWGAQASRRPGRRRLLHVSLPCVLTAGLMAACLALPGYFSAFFMGSYPLTRDPPPEVSGSGSRDVFDSESSEPSGSSDGWSLSGSGSSSSESESSSSLDAPVDEMDEAVIARLQPKNYDNETCEPSFLERVAPETEYGCEQMKRMLGDDGNGGELVGEGYWREVYRIPSYEGRELAYKKLSSSQRNTKRNKERHRWEAAALAVVKGHENVVGVLGVCECDVVTEFFPYTMDKLLFKQGGDLPIGAVLKMALQAARGMAALHGAEGGPIVHTDLKPGQLLLDRQGVVKVNDLNRCRFVRKDARGRNCPFFISASAGVWRSPEEFAGAGLTEKLDVYSMAMIFWSMLARHAPFRKDKGYKKRVINGERPPINSSWDKGFVQVIEDMWKPRPEDRLSMSEVVARLELLQSM